MNTTSKTCFVNANRLIIFAGNILNDTHVFKVEDFWFKFKKNVFKVTCGLKAVLIFIVFRNLKIFSEIPL